MRWIAVILLILSAGVVVGGLLVGLHLGDDSNAPARPTAEPAPDSISTDPIAHVTLDESGCTYEGDDTPKAPFFYLGIDNQTAVFSHVEIDRIPADVPTEEVEDFFADQQVLLENGIPFRGPPDEWRLNRRSGQYGPSTGSMLVGDPTFPDQMLAAGQRYVVWCSTGEPPTRVFFSQVLEPTE